MRSKRKAVGVEVVCSRKGDVMVVYGDSRLDAVVRLRFARGSGEVFALLPNGLVDERAVPLGSVGGETGRRLDVASEVLFVRADGDRIVGGIVALERT